jgi:aminoglycoside 3-N-acetyltransferase I
MPTHIHPLTTPAELRELMQVFALAFESEYTTTNAYLEAMLTQPTMLALGAVTDGVIVGGLIAFELFPIHGHKEFCLYDIAVHPAHQKQGIGKQLIHRLKEVARERGVETIFVEAESDDEGAVAFYRTLKGEELSVNHFNLSTNL